MNLFRVLIVVRFSFCDCDGNKRVFNVNVGRMLKIGGKVFAFVVTFTIEIMCVSTNLLSSFIMAFWTVRPAARTVRRRRRDQRGRIAAWRTFLGNCPSWRKSPSFSETHFEGKVLQPACGLPVVALPAVTFAVVSRRWPRVLCA